MAEIRSAPAAKLFVAALIAQDGRDQIEQFDEALVGRLGSVDLTSPAWPFEFTDYYTAEMGAGLVRRIVSFEEPFDPADLPKTKHITNDLEQQLVRQFRKGSAGRIINLDPGYLTLGQIVLATTKGYSHRIYLRDGIWAEVTLRYHEGRYEKWQWTYPDYGSGRYNDFWLEMRSNLKCRIQER